MPFIIILKVGSFISLLQTVLAQPDENLCVCVVGGGGGGGGKLEFGRGVDSEMLVSYFIPVFQTERLLAQWRKISRRVDSPPLFDIKS